MVALAPAAAGAVDLSGSLRLGLERDLGDIRRDLRGPQPNADHDLDRARRRLRDLEIERPRDPHILHLEREIDRLEVEADRNERRRKLGRSLKRLEAGRTRYPPPEFLRPPYATDLRGDELPIGAGNHYILIRNSLRRADQQLAAGNLAAAWGHLAAAENGMANLKTSEQGTELVADPNVIATEHEIADLRARLEAARGDG